MIVEYIYRNGDYKTHECTAATFDREKINLKTFGPHQLPDEMRIGNVGGDEIKQMIVNGRVIYDADTGGLETL